jgi:Protein of unknown function (DUF5672)
MVVRLSESAPNRRGREVGKAIAFILGLSQVFSMRRISTDIITDITDSYPPSPLSIEVRQDVPLTAILVEVRCTRTLPLVLKQAVNHLRDYDQFLIIHSAKNRPYIEKIIRSEPDLQKLLEDQQLQMRQVNEAHYGDTKSRNQYRPGFWYSRMMTDSNFWKSIETPYAITLQSDTLICRPFLANEFIGETNVSFIGGLSKSGPVDPDPNNILLVDHLNGGFSLRNVAWTIQCIEEYAARNTSQANLEGEDTFYRYCREINVTGTVHTSQQQAYSFASDNGWTMCFNTTQNGERICPFGVHKPWITKNWKSPAYVELVQNCPGLDQLMHLSSELQTCS